MVKKINEKNNLSHDEFVDMLSSVEDMVIQTYGLGEYLDDAQYGGDIDFKWLVNRMTWLNGTLKDLELKLRYQTGIIGD